MVIMSSVFIFSAVLIGRITIMFNDESLMRTKRISYGSLSKALGEDYVYLSREYYSDNIGKDVDVSYIGKMFKWKYSETSPLKGNVGYSFESKQEIEGEIEKLNIAYECRKIQDEMQYKNYYGKCSYTYRYEDGVSGEKALVYLALINAESGMQNILKIKFSYSNVLEFSQNQEMQCQKTFEQIIDNLIGYAEIREEYSHW